MRNEQELKSLRPEIYYKKEAITELEIFQNEVLRPILKYQHELIVALVKNEKQLFEQLKMEEISSVKLTQFFLKQPNYKYFLIGKTCALMTSDEFGFYLKHKKELDKRISNMITDRILSIFI